MFLEQKKAEFIYGTINSSLECKVCSVHIVFLCNLLSSLIQGVDRKTQMQIHIWSNRCRRKGARGKGHRFWQRYTNGIRQVYCCELGQFQITEYLVNQRKRSTTSTRGKGVPRQLEEKEYHVNQRKRSTTSTRGKGVPCQLEEKEYHLNQRKGSTTSTRGKGVPRLTRVYCSQKIEI